MLVQDSDVVLESYAPGLLPASLLAQARRQARTDALAGLDRPPSVTRLIIAGVPAHASRVRLGIRTGSIPRPNPNDQSNDTDYPNYPRQVPKSFRERKLSTNVGE